MTGDKASEILNSSKNEQEIFVYEVFRIIHALQTHVGMISKIFSPTNNDKNSISHIRANKLVEVLNLIEHLGLTTIEEVKNNIRATRELRDNLEHFDERFDSLIFQEDDNHIKDINLNIGKREEFGKKLRGIEYKFLRLYDPVDAVYYIFNKKELKEYKIQDLLIPMQIIRYSSRKKLAEIEKKIERLKPIE